MIGAVVAIFVLPTSTQRKLRSGVTDVLREMASMLEERFTASPPPMRERARVIDRKLRDLRVASRPLVGPFMQLGSQRPAQIVHLVGTAWHFARPLALRAGVELPAQAQAILHDAARRVAAEARAITDGRPAGDAGDVLVQARDSITAAGLLGAGPASPRAAIDWLARVASALRELSALMSGHAAGSAGVSSAVDHATSGGGAPRLAARLR